MTIFPKSWRFRPVAVLMHLTPFIPGYLGLWYLMIAAVLLVGLCYVKTFKMDRLIDNITTNSRHEDELRLVRDRWKALTFLP